MAQIDSLFVTRLYRAALSEHGPKIIADELENSCLVIAGDDEAGQDWCGRRDCFVLSELFDFLGLV